MNDSPLHYLAVGMAIVWSIGFVTLCVWVYRDYTFNSQQSEIDCEM